MNKDKLEIKLKSLVANCLNAESKESKANLIMECADEIVKNCSIQSVMTRLLTEEECKEICRKFVRAATPSAIIGGIDERFEKVWNSSSIEEKLNGA
jgi:hypothetical protein